MDGHRTLILAGQYLVGLSGGKDLNGAPCIHDVFIISPKTFWYVKGPGVQRGLVVIGRLPDEERKMDSACHRQHVGL